MLCIGKEYIPLYADSSQDFFYSFRVNLFIPNKV